MESRSSIPLQLENECMWTLSPELLLVLIIFSSQIRKKSLDNLESLLVLNVTLVWFKSCGNVKDQTYET